MLKVSQKLEYAMRAMIELADGTHTGVLVPAREIASRQQVPLRFLEQQLGALSKAGLVESFRGGGGGCRLARPPGEITVAEIADVRAPLVPTRLQRLLVRAGLPKALLLRLWGIRLSDIEPHPATTVADLSARHRRMTPGRVLVSPEQLLSRP